MWSVFVLRQSRVIGNWESTFSSLMYKCLANKKHIVDVFCFYLDQGPDIRLEGTRIL